MLEVGEFCEKLQDNRKPYLRVVTQEEEEERVNGLIAYKRGDTTVDSKPKHKKNKSSALEEISISLVDML